MADGGGNVIGYARVSTGEQNPQLQHDALAAAGAVRIFTDTVTGTSTSRPQLDACLEYLQPGNVLAVWRVDRLGRSVPPWPRWNAGSSPSEPLPASTPREPAAASVDVPR